MLNWVFVSVLLGFEASRFPNNMAPKCCIEGLLSSPHVALRREIGLKSLYNQIMWAKCQYEEGLNWMFAGGTVLTQARVVTPETMALIPAFLQTISSLFWHQTIL